MTAHAREVPAALRIGLGLALLLPVAVALIWSYVIPTVTTLITSFQHSRPSGSAELAGLDNYREAFALGLPGDLGYAVLLGLTPLLAALVVGLVLAWAAERSGRPGRLAVRVLLGLLLAAYTPVGIAVGWATTRLDSDLGRDHIAVWLALLVAASSIPLAVALSTTLFLAALRGRMLAVLPVAAVIFLGGLALAVQAYTPSLVAGGGRRETATPLYVANFFSLRQQFSLGPGAAIATVLLVVLGLLGVAAVAVLLATRTRIDPGSPSPATAPASPLALNPIQAGLGAPSGSRLVEKGSLVAAGVVLLAVLGVAGYAFWPWLSTILDSTPGRLVGPPPARTWAYTWLPPLVATLVGVLLALLGGFAIGFLRPLGRWSGALLLVFAPWLFVGVGPLAIALFRRHRDFDVLDSFLALIPPTWLTIPALVLFALFFDGCRRRWEAGASFSRAVALPALPMAGIAAAATWLIHAQDVLWPLLVARSPEVRPSPMLAGTTMQMREMYGVVQAYPLPMLLFFALVAVAAQVCYLDRVTVHVGSDLPVSA